MEKQENIRNVCIVGHVDCGRRTISNLLASMAAIIPTNGAKNPREFLDCRPGS